MIQPVLNSMNRVRTLCGCSIRLCTQRGLAMAAQSDPTRWHWPTVLRTALARSTSRTGSNHTPRARPLHSMTAKRVAAPSLRGYPSCRTTKSRSFRLHNGRRRHLKPYASSFASEGSSVQTAPWPLKHSTKIVMVDCAYCISLWIKVSA